MPILTLHNLQLSFGGPLLLDNVNLSIGRGERICLLGRNGAGKSTLMKLITRELKPDDGEMVVEKGACIVRLTQEVPEGTEGSVFDVIASGLGEVGKLVQEYHQISTQLCNDCSEALLEQLSRVQQKLEAADGWQVEQRVESVISRLSLDADIEFSALSGGLKRRVLLAQALVLEPDLLLLDEPTNHLDIASIEWLEEFLLSYRGSLLFITHDRTFLRHLATRILELDRGQLTDWPGDFDNFLRRKEEMLNAQEKENARFDKKLAQEEVWIRQGIKARRTRNEGRVRALKAMREEYRQRRERTGQVKMGVQSGERSGKLVVEVENVDYAWDGDPIIKGFSTTIMRGDKIGIIGPNGSGKSTLLGLLLGKLQPTSGTIKMGTKVEVAYFDQLRSALDDDKSVQDNVGGGSDKVTIDGREKHIISYLQDFLFTPERIRTPVRALSGGERNRLLLAKLFTKPCNVLVMDEPTNDLDAETLDLLEELLLGYKGTLLLVSHDRAFLNNVVTSSLVFEGEGRVNEYIGGYDDWLRQRAAATPATTKAEKTEAAKPKNVAKKLSYKDQRELDELPKQIEKLDAELAAIQAKMADPDFYKRDHTEVTAINEQMAKVEEQLSSAYTRWEQLEG
ncbi:MAG: ATP-binding cassette domain-containing protein [Candidatus Polarisedimenticolaceae bacterium]|nr:ATP-binding cassette domain-containing protein [Candidatus Polarisedimenticolaceae bacterium]